MIINATEILSDAGDNVAGALAGLMAWAQTQGLDCSSERETLNTWDAANTVVTLDTGLPTPRAVIHRDD